MRGPGEGARSGLAVPPGGVAEAGQGRVRTPGVWQLQIACLEQKHESVGRRGERLGGRRAAPMRAHPWAGEEATSVAWGYEEGRAGRAQVKVQIQVWVQAQAQVYVQSQAQPQAEERVRFGPPSQAVWAPCL